MTVKQNHIISSNLCIFSHSSSNWST